MGAIARFIRRKIEERKINPYERDQSQDDYAFVRHLPAFPKFERMQKIKWKRDGKIALGVFAFLFLAPIPVAEFMYLSFLLGRYGKGRRIVGRIVRRIRK